MAADAAEVLEDAIKSAMERDEQEKKMKKKTKIQNVFEDWVPESVLRFDEREVSENAERGVMFINLLHRTLDKQDEEEKEEDSQEDSQEEEEKEGDGETGKLPFYYRAEALRKWRKHKEENRQLYAAWTLYEHRYRVFELAPINVKNLFFLSTNTLFWCEEMDKVSLHPNEEYHLLRNFFLSKLPKLKALGTWSFASAVRCFKFRVRQLEKKELSRFKRKSKHFLFGKSPRALDVIEEVIRKKRPRPEEREKEEEAESPPPKLKEAGPLRAMMAPEVERLLQ